MEVLQATRFADGRMLVLAVGVSRFCVTRPTQRVPYWRADLELLPDAEEVQEWEGLALQALESVHGGLGDGSVPLTTLMGVLPPVVASAAAAAAAAWAEYELSDARLECGSGYPGVIDGAAPEEAQRMGRRLAALAGNEVLVLPFWDALRSAEQAAGAPGMREILPPGDDGGSVIREALDGQRPVLRQTAAAAHAVAASAAAAAVEEHLQRLGIGADSSSSEGAAAAAAAAEAAAAAAAHPRLNTVSDRGVALQPPSDVLDSGRWGWRRAA